MNGTAGVLPEILRVDPRSHVLVVDESSPDGTAVCAATDFDDARQPALGNTSSQPGLAAAFWSNWVWPNISTRYADWSHQPKYLKEMLALAPDAGFVIGSRYVPGGGTLNWGLARKLLSRFGSRYARWVLGVEIADFTGGFNGWHADVIRKVSVDSIRSEGYSFQIELKCRAAQLGFTTCFILTSGDRKARCRPRSLSGLEI
jgi:dolichol-phosphate mannosyltransferase